MLAGGLAATRASPRFFETGLITWFTKHLPTPQFRTCTYGRVITPGLYNNGHSVNSMLCGTLKKNNGKTKQNANKRQRKTTRPFPDGTRKIYTISSPPPLPSSSFVKTLTWSLCRREFFLLSFCEMCLERTANTLCGSLPSLVRVSTKFVLWIVLPVSPNIKPKITIVNILPKSVRVYYYSLLLLAIVWPVILTSLLITTVKLF